MADHTWMKSAAMVIFTMREVDVPRWDPEHMVGFARSFSANSIGFSCGGVSAFYPTEVPHHRRAQGLGDRDLVGETLAVARRENMHVIGRIDVSIAAKEVFLAHPEWFAMDEHGRPIECHGYFAACPNGAYYREFGPAIVREILERYAFDGLWANAAQFSPWHTPQCHCPACRRLFRAETGEDLPKENWRDPLWRRYNEWRYRRVADWCALIERTKNEVRPDCAWLPLSQVAESWDHSRRGGWELDYTEPHEDGIILEAQRRYTNMWWPGLETRYARSLAPEKPTLIGCSYFVPWWRFHAVPAAENRVWMGQVVAHGGRPQLHHSGYLSELYDRRGIESAREFLKRIQDNPDAYAGLDSAARVALVYSRHSLDNYAGEDPEAMYLNHFRGFFNALLAARIPFDILSDKRLSSTDLDRYQAIAAPNIACLSDSAEKALFAYAERGGHLVTTFMAGFLDEMGEPRESSPFLDACHVSFTGVVHRDQKAAYGQVRDRGHALLDGLGDTDLVPIGGDVLVVLGEGARGAPLTYVPPVESSPGSGISVPEHNRIEATTDAPLALEARIGQGSLVHFPWEPDRAGFRFGLSDAFLLLANALRRASRWSDVVQLDGPGLVDIAVMAAEDRLAVHLVNFSAPGSFNTGQRRLMSEIVPLHDLSLRVSLPDGRRLASARLVQAGKPIEGETQADGRVAFRIPRLEEFETVLLMLE
jgi:hypothetical protein